MTLTTQEILGQKIPKKNQYFLNRQSQFESNVRSYPRRIPLAIAHAKGAWVTDVEGKTYIDCLAGAGTLALGHNHDNILAAIRSFLESGLPMHLLDLTSPVKDAFSESLLSLLPHSGRDYCLQFCSPSGADAIEAALKLAKRYTGRRHILSFSGGYHGMTHGALAVTSNRSPKENIQGLMPNVQFLPYPNLYRSTAKQIGKKSINSIIDDIQQSFEELEQSSSLPAAVVLEVIQGEGGVNPAPLQWLQKIRVLTQKYGIVMIVDEVQTGFARTGSMFAFEESGIEPDIIVMSKAVGGGLPLALLAIKKQFDVWKPGDHTGTFRGNQLAMAAGLETIQMLKSPEITQNIAARSEQLIEAFTQLSTQFPAIAQVRGKGLMLGLEIVDEQAKSDMSGAYPEDSTLAESIQTHCINQGLIVERGGQNGNVIRFLPPLTINEHECCEVVSRFTKSLSFAIKQIRSTPLREEVK